MSSNEKNRVEQFLPNGLPRKIRVYDNGGETIDRYTVVFTGNYQNHLWEDHTTQGHPRQYIYIGMSGSPSHPLGVCTHDASEDKPIDYPTYSHLGRKITYLDLPPDCREVVLEEYCDIWEIKASEVAKERAREVHEGDVLRAFSRARIEVMVDG